MVSPSSAPASSARPPRLRALIPVLLLLAGLAAYWNSFSVPFLFDDDLSIADNPTIRQLWPPGPALTPPDNGAGVTNRPVINVSFALNYALGGLDPRGYHVANLAIHLGAALLLLGLVRRTLRQPALAGRFGSAADAIAAAAALGWLLHPLQTESVTFVIQRTESLMGLLYLLALYASVRAFSSARPLGWQILAFAACLLGMAAKEVMVTAPLLILLYDRTFVAGSFRAAWTRRRGFYLALAFTWLLLAGLVIGLGRGSRGGTCGFGTAITPWDYLRTQAEGISRYLQLTIWPHPLVVDYGTYVARNAAVVFPGMAFLGALVIATVIALRRWPLWGFAGAWFFGILGPSSSIVPLATQTLAEHRMYLPLAILVTLGAMGLARCAGRAFLPVAATVVATWGVLTVQRNHDYRSVVAIWADTAAKRPENARAHYALGTALLHDNRPAEAIPPLERAVALDPAFPGACSNLGTALSAVGRDADAARYYEQALKQNPADPDANNNLGTMFYTARRMDEAIACYRRALQSRPDYVEAEYNLALALADSGRTDEAVATFRSLLARRPDLVAGWCSLGRVQARAGQVVDARRSFEEALRRDPGSAEARAGLARLP